MLNVICKWRTSASRSNHQRWFQFVFIHSSKLPLSLSLSLSAYVKWEIGKLIEEIREKKQKKKILEIQFDDKLSSRIGNLHQTCVYRIVSKQTNKNDEKIAQ